MAIAQFNETWNTYRSTSESSDSLYYFEFVLNMMEVRTCGLGVDGDLPGCPLSTVLTRTAGVRATTAMQWCVGSDPGNDLPDCPLITALTRAAGVRAKTEKQQCATLFGVRVGGIDRGVASVAGTTVGEPKVAGGDTQNQRHSFERFVRGTLMAPRMAIDARRRDVDSKLSAGGGIEFERAFESITGPHPEIGLVLYAVNGPVVIDVGGDIIRVGVGVCGSGSRPIERLANKARWGRWCSESGCGRDEAKDSMLELGEGDGSSEEETKGREGFIYPSWA
ncbi:hypothetical protein BDN70DRAFT_901419 [Pholiota conissans]|uniref:Uncharacterized protein n=1 Tax=Pholiota conissans TaxID=109636 RepID=A0A9P5YMI7_9AGAR|nr:hypothetical protein BDN70DRAFT_901419 [Pholiota conissans]